MASSTSRRTQNILITGASSGIGEALAVQYAKSTAKTLFLCGRNEERLQDVARRCENLGSKVYTQIIDVTDREKMQDWIKSCFKKAVPDTIIANAGIGSIIETDDSIYNTFNTNVFGVINTILPAIDFYKKKKDTPEEKSIVIISSLAGYHGLATCPSYSASKAAVKAYGEALRVKLKSEKINVNVVCPGFVRSRLTDQNTCPMPFFMEAPEAAKLIIAGIRQNKAVISFPLPLRFAAWLVSILPNCLSDFIYGRLPNKA